MTDKKTFRQKRRIFLEDYKKNKSCAICGWDEHPEILSSHHKNPKEKEFSISKLSSINQIKAELEKCSLLCPNCHFWYHYQSDIRRQESRARDGEQMTRAAFGYKLENKKLMPAENSYLVQEIFQDFLNQTISLTQLAKKYDFSGVGIKKILKNQTYLGKIKYGGKIYSGKHKPLIDTFLFYQVQDKLRKLLDYYKYKQTKKAMSSTGLGSEPHEEYLSNGEKLIGSIPSPVKAQEGSSILPVAIK